MTEIINDDFSSDTSADWDDLEGTSTISGGAMHGPTFAEMSTAHDTSIGGADMFVEGDVLGGTGNDAAALMFNYVGGGGNDSYYEIYGDSGEWHLRKVDSGETFLGTITTMSNAHMRVENIGGDIEVFIDSVSELTVTNTDLTGQFCGIHINRSSNNNDHTVDNFKAGNFAAGGSITPLAVHHLNQMR